MKVLSNPTWWAKDHDTAWERTKAAMKRDWEQTKHDFGGDQPDTNQNVDNTVKQAAGKELIPPTGVRTYDDVEEAHRFGVGARMRYGSEHATWGAPLESRLRTDWEAAYPADVNGFDLHRRDIRYGYDYNTKA